MTDSPFIFRPMLLRDYDATNRVMGAAFVNSIMPFLYPNGMTEADKDHAVASLTRHLNDPNTSSRRMLAIDPSASPDPEDVKNLEAPDRAAAESEGRVIGFAQWDFWLKDRTADEIAAVKAAKKAEGLPPSADPPFWETFFSALERSQREILGARAHILLHILATEPQYHRRGVGAWQLKWGLDQADILGIPAYLEATEAGRPLYERWGFEAIRPVGVDPKWYGGKTDCDPLIMLRPAKGPSNGNIK